MTAVPILTVAPFVPKRLPSSSERTLASGLRIVVIRRASVPRVQVRMRAPLGRTPGRAVTALLGATLTAGTKTRGAEALATDMQALGGGLSASADSDGLSLAGDCLRDQFDALLEMLAETLTTAAFAADEVALERERLLQSISVARIQPDVVAGHGLDRLLFGDHPYGRSLPEDDEINAVNSTALRRLLRRARPVGAVMVIVGDVRAGRALDAAEATMSAWTGDPAPVVDINRPAPQPAPDGSLVLIDRPGAVQSNFRLGRVIPGRTDPGYAALRLASTIFGGYFSSRLVENVRERRGYSYGPRSAIDHRRKASSFEVTVDVATEVTAAAYVEIAYELSRIASAPVTEDELRSAVRYLTGTASLATQTQAGLADSAIALLSNGHELSFLHGHLSALACTTVAEVRDAAQRWLVPRTLAAIAVGDADRVASGLGSFVALSTT